MTTALEGCEWSAHPGRTLPPGKTRYPLYRRLGWLQGRSERMRETLPPRVIDPRTVQTVASRYTDYASRTHNMKEYCRKGSPGSYLTSTKGAVNISEASECNLFLQRVRRKCA